jgi:GT2 family glycosyltransferase
MNNALSDVPAFTASPVNTLSVIVCAYAPDRWDALKAAIGSVQDQTHPVDEIVLVVDHHCQDLYEKAVNTFSGVRVVPSRGRRSLSAARNTGVGVARGDIVAFLDDDAAADPGWAHRLLARYTDPRVVGVGGRIRPQWAGGRPAWFPPEFDWVVGCSYPGLPEETAPVRDLIGASMSFRRTELLAVGGFLGELGRVGSRSAGCEETELCLRIAARRPGAVLLYEPAAEVRHRVPAPRSSWSYFWSRCFGEGLSKALAAQHNGSGPVLATERLYLRSTIPRALARNLRRVRHPGALPTLGALSTGVCATVAGYAAGQIRFWASWSFWGPRVSVAPVTREHR